MRLRHTKKLLAARRITGAALHRALGRDRRGFPPVFCNSYQKAGTHLLVEMVASLPGIHNYERGAYWHGFSRSRVDVSRASTLPGVLRDLGKCDSGELYHGHVEAAPEILEFLRAHGFKTLFIYRDPRDMVVSLLHWWQRYTDIDTWPYRYFRALRSDDERLRFLIEGWPQHQVLPGFPSQVDFPDIGTRFTAYVPWLDEASCLSIRYEALRAEESREAVCRDIIHHVLGDIGRSATDSMVQGMISGADPRRSSTFRRGVGEEWRQLFGAEHRDAFKRHAGSLLISLGYEQDLDW